MSRFNSAAYDKLYPREAEVSAPETVVDSFTPSQDNEGGDQGPDTYVPDLDTPEGCKSSSVHEQDVDFTDGGDSDGDGGHSKSDPE